MEYLYIIQQALIWIVTIYWLYQFIISLCSFVKIKEKPLKEDKQHRFMTIIPAHNEEKVVVNLIESLKKLDYPKDLYDIYVIADNCTDKTAEVAKKAGAIVYERFDEAHKTKGHALQWFLAQKIEEDAPYDAFCIFDADNIVDENFLKVMNKKLCQGEEVVQGYKDIKNPSDSWVSAGYAIFYWTMHRFYHLARYNIGLSPLMNGTGFMVKFDVIKPQGWNTKTLTEDIEFSLKRIIEGKKLGWARDAIVYDEQPVGFKQSWTQRSRWTVGHMQCLKEYTKPLAEAVVKNKTVMNFDGLLYMLGTTPMLILTMVLVIVNTVLFATGAMSGLDFTIQMLKYIIPTLLVLPFMGLVVLYLEKKPIKPMIKGLLTYPIFMGSWLLINIKCLFKRDTEWKKIDHVNDKKIEDLLGYAINKKYGYLTSSLGDIGTGLKASVMVHLPALAKTKNIRKVLEAISSFGMNIRGMYGENNQVQGDIYQISNKQTLGITEQEIVQNVKVIVQKIIEQERQARKLLAKDELDLEDIIYRSYGILTNCRKISYEEARNLLSNIKLGTDLGILRELTDLKVQKLYLYIKPANLQKYLGEQYEAIERDIKRAEVIKQIITEK